MKKIQLIFMFVLMQRLFVFAQYTPCTATSLGTLAPGTCTQTNYTVAANTTWSVNGAGGVTSGLSTPTCRGTTDPVSTNYWLSFTMSASTTHNITTNLSSSGGGAVDVPEYQIFQQTGGSCGSSNMTLSLVGCGGSGANSFSPTPGATYYIRIYDDDPAGGGGDVSMSGENFNFCASLTPKNDLCANAQAITPGTAVTASTAGSAYEGTGSFIGGGACSPSVGNVWYSFTTGASPGCYSFALTNATGDNCNSVWIYSGGCPGAGGTLQNANQSTNIYNDQSSAEFTIAASTTYYISVGNSTTGNFTFNVRPNVSFAGNDQCSGASGIGTAAQLTDNAVAGCEYSYVAAQDANITPANICAGSLENVSWFTFTTQSSPATSNVVISFANISCNNGGGGFQTGLFTGANCSSLTVGTTGAAVCAAAASGTVNYTINNSPAGTVYYIAMDGNAGSNCHFSVSGTNIVPLPIELLTFDAIAKGSKQVDVTWSTATEEKNDYFTIERTLDGINFEVVGVVASQAINGNSSSVLNYSKVDSKPIKGTSYYRLKQTDYDGNYSYSALKAVQIGDFADLNFLVYPNPTGENENAFLQFSGNADDEVEITIFDIAGKVVSQKGITLSGTGNTTIELKHNFSSGMYFISATSKSGASYNQKLMVK